MSTPPGGRQDYSIISEAGLYGAILRSKLPQAKQFQRWVTHEVLPSIRKTGGYMAAQAVFSFSSFTFPPQT